MKRLLAGLLVLVCGYGLVLLVLGSSGGMGFFSPDTLEHRSRFEILCRGTEVPLFRGPYQYYRHDLVTFMMQKGYWRPRPVGSPRWFFLFQWNHMWRDGDGDLLRKLFRDKQYWIDWTNENPEKAAQFWPRILELLRNGDERKAVDMLDEIRWRS